MITENPLDSVVEIKRENDCCNQYANLVHTRMSEFSYVDQCKVCGRKHYAMTVDSGNLGALGASL